MIKLTANQARLLVAIRDTSKPIVIGDGPAGTGKTLLACMYAAERLKGPNKPKVVFTRPTVTVDEELGYLPGGITGKMDPWTRPMFDIMSDNIRKRQLTQLLDNGQIEVAPLGFMRGRTFENSVIIADEMQNSTPMQMKMLLTRVGSGTKLIITGDCLQSDIKQSGLRDLIGRLGQPLDYLSYVKLGDEDIKRHASVKEVLDKLY